MLSASESLLQQNLEAGLNFEPNSGCCDGGSNASRGHCGLERLQDQHGASLAMLMESGKKGRVSDRLGKLDRLHMTSFYWNPGLAGIYIYIYILYKYYSYS